MFMNFWWPLAASARVGQKPMRVTALQQEFVLYRTTNGAAQVLSDLCVHRGGALSDGWMTGDCVVCPYHGWEFATDGACVKIPANAPGVPVPKKARVDSYPTIEKNGWVFAFLGDVAPAERPPLADILELDGAKTQRGSITWNAPYERVLAQLGDLKNSALVLGADFADAPAALSDERVTAAEWGARITANVAPPKRIARRMGGLVSREEAAPEIRDASIALYAPCITVHTLGQTRAVMAHVPVDAATTITEWAIEQPIPSGNGLEKLRVKIENGLMPENAIGAALKRINQAALKRGWSINSELISAEYTNVKAVVIPSPARREVPELAAAWVLKKVPTRLPDF
jgi:nitrite reductase/ring-hydroxylating ferredoxin subunit